MTATQKDKELANMNGKNFTFLWFSELLNRPVCAGAKGNRLGRLSDLVFQLTDPHPPAVGIYLDHGWGKPTEFIPWERVLAIKPDAILVQEPEGDHYPPFVDQSGWILVDQHLMGKTILDTDGRRMEVVNDVHLLESKGRMIIAHVDVSFNGFLRKWGLGRLRLINDSLISWRYVQPFSLEDAVKTDTVSLSATREQAKELPGEDLADVVEMLSGQEQEAFFSVLDTEKAAETLIHAEPRAKRQLIEDLPPERAQAILAELSIPQLADLFSVLPHDDVTYLIQLLPPETASRISQILSKQEVEIRQLMSSDYSAFPPDATVGSVITTIRRSGVEPHMISYVYVVGEDGVLIGVIDLRGLILADDGARLDDIMSPSVVSVDGDKTRDELEEIFAKYRYRMIPVVNAQDHLLGVVTYNDLRQSLSEENE